MPNDHDPYHYYDYRNWAEKAKPNGRDAAGALLKEAAEMSLALNDRYQKTLGLIGDG